jgi:hypothetical protein
MRTRAAVARRLAAMLVLACLLVSACRGGTDHQAGADHQGGAGAPVRLGWHEARLPATSGRMLARDLLRCSGRWYLVGAVATVDGSRPAAWSSVDGQTWSAVPVAPVSYYGPRHVLYAAGCRDGRLAALGAAPGGAHGNPRTAAWYQRPDGTLTELPAAFELYGGPNAVAVTRIAGIPDPTTPEPTTPRPTIPGPSTPGPTTPGPSTPGSTTPGSSMPGSSTAGSGGWVIAGGWLAGNGRAGAAAWSSTATDPPNFRRTADDPALASATGEQTSAADVAAGPDGFVMVGNDLRFAHGTTTTTPIAWSSPDGQHWTRDHLPNPNTTSSGTANPGASTSTMERVVVAGPSAYAIGQRGTEIGVWRRATDTTTGDGKRASWQHVGTINARPGTDTSPVQSLTATGHTLAATVVDGAAVTLWLAGTKPSSWAGVAIPAKVSSDDDDNRLLTAAAGSQLLLAADSGAGTHLWLTSLPGA